MAPKQSRMAPIAKSKAKGGNGLVVAKWNNANRQGEKTEWKRFSQNLEKASPEALLVLMVCVKCAGLAVDAAQPDFEPEPRTEQCIY